MQRISDDDLVVKIGDHMLQLSSKCCILQPNGRPDTNNTLAASNNCIMNHTGSGILFSDFIRVF